MAITTTTSSSSSGNNKYSNKWGPECEFETTGTNTEEGAGVGTLAKEYFYLSTDVAYFVELNCDETTCPRLVIYM
jgi:hypothetical protein